jgi:hypothetical protein
MEWFCWKWVVVMCVATGGDLVMAARASVCEWNTLEKWVMGLIYRKRRTANHQPRLRGKLGLVNENVGCARIVV